MAENSDYSLDVLSHGFADRPSAPAMHFLESSRGFDADAARRAVAALGGWLDASDVEQGARVGVVMERTPAAVLTALAVLASGRSLVPFAMDVRASELERHARFGQINVMVAPSRLSPVVPRGSRHLALDDDQIERRIAQGAEPPSTPLALEPSREGMILFSSGTVGHPKAIVLSRGALVAAIERATVRLSFYGPDQRFLGVLPLHSGHGIIMTLLAPLYAGAELFIDRAFDAFGPARFFENVAERKITGTSCVPAILTALRGFYDRAGRPGRGSLMGVCCASSMLPPDLRRWAAKDWGVALHNNYGMSETCSWLSIGIPGDVDGEPLSVGVPHLPVEVVDDEGRPVEPGVEGHVMVSGDQLMDGYWNDKERTAEVLRDGRFHTGDLGRLTDDGRLVITGRTKDLINVAGEKVHPENVELAAMPMAGVEDAGAFPLDDERTGEAVALAVVGGGDPAEMETALRVMLAETLKPVEMPKRIFIMPSIPRNRAGKILRAQLAAECLEAERIADEEDAARAAAMEEE